MKYVVKLIIVLVFLLAVVFGYMALVEYGSVMSEETKMEVLREIVIREEKIREEKIREEKIKEEKIKEEKIEDEMKMKEEREHNVPLNRRIDFCSLKKINEDIVGWIYIPDTSIDYPILIGSTDDAYLYKNFEGKDNKTGSIFSYADTNRDLWDARTILFGHNMKRFSMFGELKLYTKDRLFRKEHEKIYIYTEKNTMELEIFSVFICDNTDSILYDNTEMGTFEYQELLKTLMVRNQYADVEKGNISEKYHNRTFSLITCWGNVGTNERLVINAIVSEEIYIWS